MKLNFQLLSALSMLSHRVLHNPEIMLQHPKLPLGVGDVVNVLAERGGWLYGQLVHTGRHGWFPRECVAARHRVGLKQRLVQGYKMINSMIG